MSSGSSGLSDHVKRGTSSKKKEARKEIALVHKEKVRDGKALPPGDVGQGQ